MGVIDLPGVQASSDRIASEDEIAAVTHNYLDQPKTYAIADCKANSRARELGGGQYYG